ncbi:ABC transporter substrate-binding protein [Pajaroellobacter abortibovis]|uniref:ABC transporter substrate-binding protein n=1 Tax=Pajaroellobacter abortibovis TaxID=1882918 RepID=A0A1L6MYM2_9BACT|nr:ABC transporter substrate-binding protein [Pajaroellobacter abortibovis]APS00515.1 hypothetical protein BCY86_07380 [Pajaroellobacter abortibovis]
MPLQFRKISTFLVIASVVIACLFFLRRQQGVLRVAIASWGSHASLDETIKGIKDELDRQGLREGEHLRVEVKSVHFDAALIPQMLSQLKASRPHVMIALSTPVAQTAKNTVKDIPLIFSAVTDPVEAGLLERADRASSNMTGVADRQNLTALLQLTKQILPKAKVIGMLYSTAEANDTALVKMMERAAQEEGMRLVTVPVEQARDVPLRMQAFRDKVDFLYVGTSGAIQPTLPAIVAEADKMKLPVFNADSDAVKSHQALGSCGVKYNQVGAHTGKMVARILRGESVEQIQPVFPTLEEHQGFISRVKANFLRIALPTELPHVTIVE